MSTTLPQPGAEAARRVAFAPNWTMRIALLALALYTVWACSRLGLSWDRVAHGMGEGGRLLARMVPPNFERWSLLLEGLLESLQIAVLASAIGILLSLPLGVLAARNLSPVWISAPVRAVIAVCRSLHYVIVAILFVKAIGFGALAGTAALVVASIGFIAKLFAEAIEEISMKQVEAIRATGAGVMKVLAYAVLPQVASRFIGFSLYQLDSNLRNSTLVGIVGAGGIGGTLFAAFKRFDYDFVAAILLAIIALIFLAEIISGRVRAALR
ncbi:phosphonate ABC transporter, permease protein PhnE [Teichococcus cervicalis]|uniref:Phosphonate ABC transporter, permease protein PhnE n=1 Tax=Pseudoroseomonas cervicalis ATCC 49957 TaxID=525371 RepID=D5RGY0_9PROT|nr:phosphonate ABC transporter, permease protein PhnE [Pseudoroseomonas cervicalis]EFH13444.1 phosphonate ABC transporter, permease protein PhnE [Pseudoroseomonas cervicalis ATCC 49957]